MFRRSAVTVCFVLLFAVFAVSQTPSLIGVKFIGMGDSIGEGVQSGDASIITQPYSYLHLIALRAGASFPLPLILTTPLSSVGDVQSRYRLEPSVSGFNLAVSGADVHSLLNDRADSITDSETDLVLMPRTGSQMEIAETLNAEYVACWIGNNDALSAVLAFDKLDASQLTPLSEFTQDFTSIATRLKNTGAKVVYGTIPDVSSIGVLLSRDAIAAILGSSYGMAPGDRTSIVTLLVIALGVLPPTILQDPNYVLSAAEADIISTRISDFNNVIKSTAAANGAVVADTHRAFDDFLTTPPVFFGIPLYSQYLGGLFSLDGVHPSNIAHGLLANEFIKAFNTGYGAGFPLLDQPILEYLFLTDPFIDKDRDGRVTGRPGAGLLETLIWLMGISGDPNDFDSTITAMAAEVDSATPDGSKKSKTGLSIVENFARLTGKNFERMSRQERLNEIRRIFGLKRFGK